MTNLTNSVLNTTLTNEENTTMTNLPTYNPITLLAAIKEAVNDTENMSADAQREYVRENDALITHINESIDWVLNDNILHQFSLSQITYVEDFLYRLGYGSDAQGVFTHVCEKRIDDLRGDKKAEKRVDYQLSSLSPEWEKDEISELEKLPEDIQKSIADGTFNNTNEELTMTNTNNEELTMTNTTNQEIVNMNEVNKSALVSTMAAELFHQKLTPITSLVVATAYVGAIEYMDDVEDFMEALVDGLENTTIDVLKCEEEVKVELDDEAVTKALVDANYLTDDGIGTRLVELANLRSEAYAPTTGMIKRRFNYAQVRTSPLAKEAIHALEATPYTKDAFMEGIALQVQAALGESVDKEGYVLKGCMQMDANLAYFSEFKGDKRIRLYQAACHGPNGQSSDRSRALMNLHGVPTDYNIELTKQLVRAEVMDMVSCDTSLVGKYMTEATKNPVKFIVDHLEDDEDHVKGDIKKPWSFVKAAFIWKELAKGNRPYIGMAVGLDAKCSGPQLGALMVGDQAIAAACGMTLVELEDAYHIAITELGKAGFHGITRNGIKKAYMGVFYGQGWMAYTNIDKESKEYIGMELEAAIYKGGPVNDDTAKVFHKALTKSFGAKMVGVRQIFKDFGDKTQGRTVYDMPDNSEVAMNYKIKVNILGQMMDFDTIAYDVVVRNNTESYKFINFQMKTRDVHVGDFARNGFVNMIQATDALIARLIIVHLKRLGAKHIISVHDCFRVNITEMHLLEQAIINAYMDLFGSEFNNATKDLPLGTDILGLYFKGANKQLLPGFDEVKVSQFFDSGKRRMRKINGQKVADLINALGQTYYFAK